MRKFIKFTAKYLGETSSFDVIECLSPDKAQDYIKMKNNLHAGYVFFSTYQVLEPDEALKYTIAFIKSAQDDDLEDTPEYINNLLSNLKECYGIDYNPQN